MTGYASLAQTLTTSSWIRPAAGGGGAGRSRPRKGFRFLKGFPLLPALLAPGGKELFAANDADHMNCPIGAMVMGFELTSEAKEGLQRGLTMMCEVGYVKPEEAEQIPALAKKGKAMLYGPLSNFPVVPEVVVIWLQPAQAMLLREATGDAEWKSDVSSKIFGRPACAALAVASQGAAVSLSFGCSGMRTFTGVEPAYMLAALSGRLLDHLEPQLRRTHKANCAMQAFYDQQKSYFPFKKRENNPGEIFRVGRTRDNDSAEY
ncbi:MAG: DUF169 domain-containing protein [Candidatus Manganitrophus sp.]|nr:MAG: DUF169 domain-containing protein [Candidatus Manganitrophus sp.]